MVKKLWLLSLLVVFAGSGLVGSGLAHAGANLSIKLDKKTLALGEPLILEIRAVELNAPLSGIGLDKLKQDFNVFSVSSNVQSSLAKGRRIRSESMTLTLYPLRSGKLHIPALTFKGFTSLPQTVFVLEKSKHVPRVFMKAAMDTPRPQVRQAATLTLDVYDDGSLQWTSPKVVLAEGAHQRLLADSQQEEELDGVRYIVHRYAWALMPLREGRIVVEFPLLDAFKFGNRLRYAVAPLKFNATPVPAYLPVYVPIGKPIIAVQELPKEIAVDRPINWVISVQGSGISEAGLSKLFSYIHSNADLRFYPLQINNTGNGGLAIAEQNFEITLPFVPLHTGLRPMPEIALPYFDPVSARVEMIVIPSVAVEIYSPTWRTIKKISIRMFVLFGIIGTLFALVKRLKLRNAMKIKLLVVKHAVSTQQLKQALLNYEIFDNKPCMTLQQWLAKMQPKYIVDERLHGLVMKISDSSYGLKEGGLEMSELATNAAQCLSELTIRTTR